MFALTLLCLVLPQKEIARQTYLLYLFKYCLTNFPKQNLAILFFHQNAAALARTFDLTNCQASSIVAVCPDCQRHSFPSVAGRVNPRGLQSLQL